LFPLDYIVVYRLALDPGLLTALARSLVPLAQYLMSAFWFSSQTPVRTLSTVRSFRVHLSLRASARNTEVSRFTFNQLYSLTYHMPSYIVSAR
jgi:hypothetical protein